MCGKCLLSFCVQVELRKIVFESCVYVVYPGKQGPHSASLSGVPATRTVAL